MMRFQITIRIYSLFYTPDQTADASKADRPGAQSA